jgi:NADPH:quinone reductase-like Zn-dependent oxidoreductase
MLHSLLNKGRIRFYVTTFKREDFDTMREMVEAGKLTPFVERTYPLAETADAMRHLGTGHTRGKVAISMVAK